MRDQEEFKLENEEEVYREFIDDFERFTSGKQKRNQQFQQASDRKLKNLQKKAKKSNINNASLKEKLYERNNDFQIIQERNLVAKRYRSLFLEKIYNEMDSIDKINKFLQKLHTRLQNFKTNEWIDYQIQSLIHEIGLTLKIFEQGLQNSPLIQKQMRKYFQDMENISKLIENGEKQEDFMQILNMKI